MPSFIKWRSDIAYYRTGRWLEYTIMFGIAILLAWVALESNSKAGLIIGAGSLALVVLCLCLYHIEIGVYGMMAFGFLMAFLSRMFMGRLPLDTILLLIPFVLLGILLMRVIRERDTKWITWHPIIFIYLMTVGYTIVESLNPRMDSFLGWLSFFRGTLVFLITLFVFLYIFKNIKNIRFFFKFILGLFLITGLYGCIQQKLGLTSFEYRWLYSTPGVAQLYSLPGQGLRKFSFLTDPANFGTLMATAATGIIILLSGPFKKTKKIILGISIVIILLGMSYSGTRTAYITTVAGIALYIIMTIYRKRTLILAAGAALVLLMILYVPVYSNVTINRIRSAFQPPSSDASYDLRNIHRHEMQPFMHTHPFGNGINTTMGAGKKYNPHNFMAGFPPDNGYFQITLEQGWVGLVLNCLFLFSLLFYAVHYFYTCKNKEIKNYYLVVSAMLFTMILGAYTQFTITSIPQNFVFIALIACIIKLHTFDSPELSKSIILKPYQ